MAIAIQAWQYPSVGGYSPRGTTQGQNTVQEQFKKKLSLDFPIRRIKAFLFTVRHPIIDPSFRWNCF